MPRTTMIRAIRFLAALPLVIVWLGDGEAQKILPCCARRQHAAIVLANPTTYKARSIGQYEISETLLAAKRFF
jgi:ABC-type nitrate/sulfonate/bicarbonate transport system permease component